MVSEPGGDRGLTRRHALTLLALTLPAACATKERTTGSPPAAAPPATSPATAGPGPAKASPRATAKRPAAAKPSAAAERTPLAASAMGGPVPYRDGKAMLGSYLSLGGMTLTQSLALRRRQLGRGQRIVHKFYPWSGYAPVAEPDVPRDSVLMVSWKGARYSQITNGSSDRLIATMATRMAGMKRPIMLRWGWEMNGNWFAWDGTHNGRRPAGYITAWRRLHRIFQEHGAGNVAWVWGPNWNSGPDVAWNHMRHYYPGDAYVDWVGVSGYDFDGESPARLFSGICSAYGARKPVVLAETAAVGSPASRAKWIRKLSAFVDATPSVGAVVWFDTDVQHGAPYNFRPDSSSAALAAYRSMARSARFAG